MNIVLIGLKSSGKTSVGKVLAAKLGKKFVDTDELVIKHHSDLSGSNQSIREICLQHGEPYFRDLEKKAIATLSSLDEVVVATGGGSVVKKENVDILKKQGMLIYLDLSFEAWKERIEQQPLPTFIQNKNLADHYAMRKLTYQKIADLTIKVDQQSVGGIVEMICIRMSDFELQPVTCNL